MKVRTSLLVVLVLGLLSAAVERVSAAPQPPQLAVNHESKECAELWPGDECTSCSPPAGWEVLGRLFETECPAGYAVVEIETTCTRHKGTFCCTEGHSGAPGDCEDVVINRAAEQCAFVEDIAECVSLPPGWEAHGEDCPYHSWADDDIDCAGEESRDVSVGADLIEDGQVIIALVLCLLACSIPVGVVVIVLLVWLARRR